MRWLTELKAIRVAKGMTQSDLANTMGVTQPVITMWESGTTVPNGAKLPDLADALCCSIDALYGRTPPGQDAS